MKLVYDPEGENKKEEIKNEAEEHVLSKDISIKDEIKKQRKSLKGRPFKEKFAYYKDYYLIITIAVIAVVAFVVYLISSIASNKDYCFYANIVNATNIDSTLLSEGFAEYASLDTENYNCFIDSASYESLDGTSTSDIGLQTRFVGLIATGDLDVTVFNSELFYRKAINDIYLDLRDVLSDDELKAYEDKDMIYYIDRAEITAAEENDDVILEENTDSDMTLEEQAEELKLHTDPSSMEDPIPIGIVLSSSPLVTELDAYPGLIPVFGIIANSSHIDNSLSFLNYILDESVDFTKMSSDSYY